MKKMKVYYWLDMPNFGDALNLIIPETFFDVEVVQSSPEECDATFIGSTLDDFLLNNSKKCEYEQYISKDPVIIWGSGFIVDKNLFSNKIFGRKEKYFRRINPKAVRGKLSRNRLEEISEQDLSGVLLADSGLLAGKLPHKMEKLHSVGIIPHHLETNLPVVEKIHGLIPNSIVISMEQEPGKVINQIASCDFILSSALHGLIVADSMNIPNLQLKLSNKLKGGMYKFNDYYSSYSTSKLHDRKILTYNSIKKGQNVIQNTIIDNYFINFNEVKDKQNKLLETFPC